MQVQLLCLWFGLLQVNGSVNSIVAVCVCVSTIMKSFWLKYWGGGGSSPSSTPFLRHCILETIITLCHILLITPVILILQLAPLRLNRYHDDLLFYLYYIKGGDLMQILAAAEL